MLRCTFRQPAGALEKASICFSGGKAAKIGHTSSYLCGESLNRSPYLAIIKRKTDLGRLWRKRSGLLFKKLAHVLDFLLAFEKQHQTDYASFA